MYLYIMKAIETYNKMTVQGKGVVILILLLIICIPIKYAIPQETLTKTTPFISPLIFIFVFLLIRPRR